VVVIDAWHNLHRLKREAASYQEFPIAQLLALTANLNRDPKKQPRPFEPMDFCVFTDKPKDESRLTPETAAAALALRQEGLLPPIIISAWPHVLSSVQGDTPAPSVRALKSDCGRVWVLAPSWDGSNIRGGLVAVHGKPISPVKLRDVDRPLMTFDVTLPKRASAGWLEGGLLLVGT